jgi:hypothetical protein
LYLALGISTELRLLATKPLAKYWLEDFCYYERALDNALKGTGPYATRSIGQAYLYPPPTLLLVEGFHYLRPFFLKALVYSLFNVALLAAMVYALARFYGYTGREVWWWYVICLGFAPCHEHRGQAVALFTRPSRCWRGEASGQRDGRIPGEADPKGVV